MREFLSQTNDLSSYCCLTDGGHFDNTGLYSLVQRGCRHIVVVDCGADPAPPSFEDLGDALDDVASTLVQRSIWSWTRSSPPLRE